VTTLHIYRVITPEGVETYVLAPDYDEARNVYCDSYELPDGEYRLFRIEDWCDQLEPDRRHGLDAVLEQGKQGVVTWEATTGWTMLPRRSE
jgi:hypothetical protein